MSITGKRYKIRGKEFLWGDNYWNENGKIWFVSSNLNIIFCIDEKTSVITPVAKIPFRSRICFRLHPRCIKYGEKIFCIPDMGEDIYIYNLKQNSWKKIIICNTNNIKVAMYDFWICDNLLYVVSSGLNKVFVLDLEKETLLEDYDIITDGSRDRIVHSIKRGNFIYSLSSNNPKIYKFDCEQKTVNSYLLPNIEDRFYTISFDGEKFWLSGYCKKLYIWNEISNTIKILGDFPVDFGNYDFSGKKNKVLDCKSEIYSSPTFIFSTNIDNYIWFIPFRTNKILYIEKDKFLLHEYYLEDEIRTEKDMKEGLLDHMYLFEYVKEDRYLGLLSLKTGNIIEIDVSNLQDKKIEYTFDENCDEIIIQNIFEENHNFYENEQLVLPDLLKFNKKSNVDNEGGLSFKVGKSIYMALNNV